MLQGVLSAAEKKVKEAQKGLSAVADEIKQVHVERSSIAVEKREKTGELRRCNSVLTQISKKIGEHEKEKSALEKAKQESILA